MMYTLHDLKPRIKVTQTTVCCPVLGCSRFVPRQVKVFRRSDEFLCPDHHIYIGPTTFEYKDEVDNLLWSSGADLTLLRAIKVVKRESRIARERSEDAVSWNVFRGLEHTGQLSAWLASVIGSAQSNPDVHYWSFDQTVMNTWPPLERARGAFAELPSRCSEPDLVIETKEADIWIEAKVGSSNNTEPSDEVGARNRYSEGADGWLAKVCFQDFDSIAVTAKRYELLRLWLLGSHAAHLRSKRFVLVNLVCEGREKDVEAYAANVFRQGVDRKFRRATWESILPLLSPGGDQSVDRLRHYLQTKTLGYDSAGRLVKAFAV